MELQLQQQVCDYLRLQYPGVLFRSDYAAGLKLTAGQAVMHGRLQASRAWPDLFIAMPRHGYAGLFIELKRDGFALRVTRRGPRRNVGDWVSDHVAEQAAMLDRLRGLGYMAEFGVGFEGARQLIDGYLN